MGYEVMRFTHKIDEEFHCFVCARILKDAMQSPCEHLFCYECIRGWIAVGQSCPVQCGPLKLEDMKPALRTIRILINKFQIKCDFESRGCPKVVKLENLDDHVGRCEFNPNAKVICDKGCNIEMRRHEFETKNCFTHLADETICLRIKQEHYDDKVVMLNDEIKCQSKEIQKLNDELNRRGVEIERLDEDLKQIRSRKDEFVKLKDHEISNESNVLFRERPEFRMLWGDGTISIDQNVLAIDSGLRCAQSLYALERTNFSFKFEILSLRNFIGIGLAKMSQSSPTFTAYYRSDGWSTFNNNKCVSGGPAWKVRDTIECGITFPSDFVNDGRKVRIYFKKNGKLMRDKLIAMPMNGLYPTFYMYGGSKIKYMEQPCC